jgi:hypothetical protein
LLTALEKFAHWNSILQFWANHLHHLAAFGWTEAGAA